MFGYKLFRVRKDGTLGSLFINKKERLPIGKWIKAESYPTKGYKFVHTFMSYPNLMHHTSLIKGGSGGRLN
tara:strand:- start:430 stop:642 length:213 start_codon:yes stop_codon:yes gene_type:complete